MGRLSSTKKVIRIMDIILKKTGQGFLNTFGLLSPHAIVVIVIGLGILLGMTL